MESNKKKENAKGIDVNLMGLIIVCSIFVCFLAFWAFCLGCKWNNNHLCPSFRLCF